MTQKRKVRPVQIIFEDDQLIILEKQAGVLSVPDRYDPELFSVAGFLQSRYEDIFIVHRLDRDTSGLMVFAKTELAHKNLNAAFESHRVGKEYRLIAGGRPSKDVFDIDYPLRINGDRKHRTVVDHRKGKVARTRFEFIRELASYSLLRALPTTGRTHQIRAHAASVGLPIVCDELYGSVGPIYLSKHKRKYSPGKNEERPLIARLALHASKIAFSHPLSGDMFSFESEDPRDFSATIKQLSKLNTN